jgi:SAM-dependent methyltransferase
MEKAALDARKATAFTQQMVDVLNGGALSLMLSIGHRTGLFDVMAGLAPSTSAAIAARAGLSERYVREWLGALVTGGIVEYDDAGALFRLPPENAAALTREAKCRNLAATAQWIPLLGAVEDEMVRCFERGGGVPYASFERFHAVLAEASEQTASADLLDHVLPLVPGLRSALESGIDVLDVGCGGGRALHLLARSFPKSRFTGFDLSSDAIARARQDAAARRLSNLRFELRDAAEVTHTEAFDLILAFDAIPALPRPAVVLAAIARALRPDGVFVMQTLPGTSHLAEDAKHPLAPLLYTLSCLHCVTVSLAADGEGLGAMWGEEVARRMLAETGFGAVDVHTLPDDAMNRYYVARPRR